MCVKFVLLSLTRASDNSANLNINQGRACCSIGWASGPVHSWCRFDSPIRNRFFSQNQLSVNTLLQSSHSPLWAVTRINICAHVKDPIHWKSYHWWDSRKNSVLGQPSKMECNCLSGRGITTNHKHNPSPQKWVYCLHRRRNAEEEDYKYTSKFICQWHENVHWNLSWWRSIHTNTIRNKYKPRD